MDPSILHLINRFYVGGAERQFIERLRAHPSGFRPLAGCLELSGGNLDDFLALGLPKPFLFPTRGSLLRANTGLQIWRIAETVRRENVRIIHGTDFVTNLLALLAGRLSGARVVVSRVDLGHARPAFGPGRRKVEKLVSAAADVVCANAEAVRQLCISDEGCDPARVAVVRNGIDLVRFDRLASAAPQGPIPEGAPLVAVVANLWPVKGHRAFLEAAALARAQVLGLQFALVGDGPERPFLVERAKDLGIADCVHFLGTRYDVPAILARADFACLPSQAEGLSNALMEAMAAGLPAVATAVGGNAELVAHQETGLVVPAGDPRGLADALIALSLNPERRRAMGKKARTRAERELSLGRMQQGYAELYRNVLDFPLEQPAPS